MSGYRVNIEHESITNTDFRRVLFTAPNVQLVVMSLGPGEETGETTLSDADQFIRVEFGRGKAVLDGQQCEIVDGWAVIIPTGTEHNIINTSETEVLKFYMIYSRPHLPGDAVQQTKVETMASVAENH